jgi:hypothetical protein
MQPAGSFSGGASCEAVANRRLTLCLGRDRDHIEPSRECGPFLFAAVPRGQFLHFIEKLVEAGGMMHDENGRAVIARVVKAMDRLPRNEGEGAGSSDVPLVANA